MQQLLDGKRLIIVVSESDGILFCRLSGAG